MRPRTLAGKFALETARHRIGRRGAFLAFLAFLDYVYAFAFWRYPHITPLVIPSVFWSIAWLIAALFCTVGIFLRKDRVPYTAGAAIKGLFAVHYLYFWLVRDESYGWLNALFWLGFALVVVMVSSWADPVLTEYVAKQMELQQREQDT